MPLVGKSLDAVTVSGPGSVLAFDKPMPFLSMQVQSTGSPTYNCILEISLDGVNFFAGNAGGASDNLYAMSFSGGAACPVLYARAHLTTITGGTSPTVTAIIAAAD